MALFKISKGKSSNLPTNKVDGYCYVTTNDHKFYVDYTKDDGTLDRFALNAVYADIAQKLGTIDVGNSNKPIYLEKGTPKECVDFLPLSAGENKKLTGPLGLTENINYGTSLPDDGFVGQLFFVEDENTDGPSLPTGGTAGQVLVKNSSTDGDASWVTDIVGNAASATKLATARTISLTGSVTGSGAFDGSGNLSISTTTNHTHNSLISSDSAGTLTWSGDNMLSSANRPQTKLHFGLDSLYRNDGNSYYKILDSGNYTSYTVTKDGSGASGTWGINISGNAATATRATQDGNGNAISSTYLPLQGGTMTGHITMLGSVLYPYSNSMTQSTPSSINYYEPIQWYDKNNKRIGAIGTTSYTNGEFATHIQTQREINGINYYQQLYLVINANGESFCRTTKMYGAVWNDYAEFRICKDNFKPGQVVCENNDDTLSISTCRLQPGANIVSDTFGFAIGETDEAKCPIAVSGRVLAYTHEPREEFNAGDAVCAGPNGTVSKMTREEIREYPERIIGTVSAVPDYETWGSGNVPVNGRIWIKVK